MSIEENNGNYAELVRERNISASDGLLARLRQHHPERSPPDITKTTYKAAAPAEPEKVDLVPVPSPDPEDLARREWEVALSARRAQLPRGLHSFNPIRTIARCASAHFKMTVADVLSERRTADVVRARHIVMYLAKTLTTMSLPNIGRKMGGFDHTTIMNGVGRIQTRMAIDPTLSDDVAAVRELAIAADPALGAMA